MNFNSETKKYIPINLSRIVLGIVLAFFSFENNIFDLFYYSLACNFFSIIWFFLYHFNIIDINKYPKIEFFPTFIDVLIISYMVISSGGPNSFAIAAYFYMTAVCSLNTKINQGLFSLIVSIFSLIIISIAMYFDFLTRRTFTGFEYEKNLFIYIISNTINIVFNFSIYFTIHSLIKKNEDLYIKSIEEKNKAEKANKLKNEILANMSHEIRTPMNAILGMTNHLIEEEKNLSSLESLNIIKFSADQLLVIINDILDLSKIDEGKVSFEKIDFSLKNLIENIIKLNLSKAIDKKIQLNFEYDSSIPLKIIGDPTRLAQILNNLISNAIKFTEIGEVKLKIIQLKNTSEFTNIHFLIKDSGIGIPEDKLEFIFEKFNQASTETTRKFGGTGLGLSIVKKLIQLMGSDVGVKSKLSEGSEFYFLLNFPISKNFTTEPSIKSLEIEEKNLNGLKILLVDDNEINIKIAKKFLDKWNTNIDTALNGKEAIEKFLEKKDFYDLILMDLQMPIMDGYEASKQILEYQKSSKKIPIFALTADAMFDTKEKVKSIGIEDLITKPFKPEELFEKLSFIRNIKDKIVT